LRPVQQQHTKNRARDHNVEQRQNRIEQGAVRAIRAYTGYRPACADHLPVIGPDPLVAGLYHATGHEGAGIGLAPATAELLTALIDHAPPPVDPAPFSPGRFHAQDAAQQTTGGHDDR